VSSVDVIGYLDRLTARPGDTISCMISTIADRVAADVVRLVHGDRNPAGPGFKAPLVTEIAGFDVPGGRQELYMGSCMVASEALVGHDLSLLTLQAWIYPTAPRLGTPQGIVSLAGADGDMAAALAVTEDGQLGVYVRGATSELVLSTGAELLARRWYGVAATFDSRSQRVFLKQTPLHDIPGRSDRVPGVSCAFTGNVNASHVMIAALSCPKQGRQWRPYGVFDGKIERPRITQGAPDDPSAPEVADWRFETRIDSAEAVDASGRGNHGVLVNMPMRAATGRLWTGRTVDHTRCPEEYAAIHFHRDDLEDASWPTSARIRLPSNLASGVYAVRLSIADEVDYVPFAVTAPPDRDRAKICFLMPTFTYVAYANERLRERIDYAAAGLTECEPTPGRHDVETALHPEYGLSLYDLHGDGSGCCYSSYLRPIPNLRPDYRMWLHNAPRHLAADLYIIDWLEARGFSYDVVTDHDLHAEGGAALAGYQAIITGSHPEYCSEQMLDALEGHVSSGGCVMYLGGNGFYWVTSQDPSRPHILEVRRGHAGSRPWDGAPGESYHSSTGEPGGLWRHRGRSPNSLVGVGMTAQGWDLRATGYRRTHDSYSTDTAFVFAGVEDTEVIGDFGLVMSGASGDELDRYDETLGSPPHAVVLASSMGHSDFYQLAAEDVLVTQPGLGGRTCPKVRSDMVLVEHSSGAAVFSVGSICFSGALSHNDYRNNVSRIVENVLLNFVGRADRASDS